MNYTRDFVKVNRHGGRTHPGLPFMNIDEVLSSLNTWLDCRRNDDLPMLVVLEGPQSVGKSSLSELLSQGGGSILKLDSRNLLAYLDEIAANTPATARLKTKTILIDDADRCDQMDLLNVVLCLLDLGARVILLVRTAQRMAAALIGNAAMAKMTRFGFSELDQESSLPRIRE
jgi:predicted AAA+ superfamily ATPase